MTYIAAEHRIWADFEAAAKDILDLIMTVYKTPITTIEEIKSELSLKTGGNPQKITSGIFYRCTGDMCDKERVKYIAAIP